MIYWVSVTCSLRLTANLLSTSTGECDDGHDILPAQSCLSIIHVSPTVHKPYLHCLVAIVFLYVALSWGSPVERYYQRIVQGTYRCCLFNTILVISLTELHTETIQRYYLHRLNSSLLNYISVTKSLFKAVACTYICYICLPNNVIFRRFFRRLDDIFNRNGSI